jgi:hypothetical protein
LKYKFVPEKLAYDGSQLRSLFGYLDHHILGDSIIAFVGPCDIPFEHMVDGEDLLAKAAIRGREMLHFIIEEFGKNLELAVTRQRLLACLVREVLAEKCPAKNFLREGDDIFVDGGKLSISIATVSPVSSLIHFAMNVTNEGTPVKTSSLKDLNLEAPGLAEVVAHRYLKEIEGIHSATQKVKWVK